MKRELGLDKPLYQQYFIYMKNLFRGDLGISYRTFQPVSEDLKRLFPATLELTLVTMLVAMPLGIMLGIISATKRGHIVDFIARSVGLWGVSIPLFWLGLLLQLFFYGMLGWLPATGRLSDNIQPPDHITGLYLLDSLLTGNWVALADSALHLILPTMTLLVVMVGIGLRITRASALEVLDMDYVKTARAKGLTEFIVIYKHVLRNALIPLITIWALESAKLIGGAVIVEVIFAWPGIGLYAVHSVLHMDFPAITGVTLFAAVVFLLFNLMADFGCRIVDPRIRHLD